MSEIKSQVDKVWYTFWTGGSSNPIEIIEQVTYLLFLKRLDEAQTRTEKQALRTGKPAHNLPFPLGTADQGAHGAIFAGRGSKTSLKIKCPVSRRQLGPINGSATKCSAGWNWI